MDTRFRLPLRSAVSATLVAALLAGCSSQVSSSLQAGFAAKSPVLSSLGGAPSSAGPLEQVAGP